MDNNCNPQSDRLLIVIENDQQRERAAALKDATMAEAITLARDIPSQGFGENVLLLEINSQGVGLRSAHTRRAPLRVDFQSATLRYRLAHGGRKREAIARAVGLKGRSNPCVFDLTAGLGRDAYILAALGCTMHLFERNPLVAALLEDGLRRSRAAEADGPASRMFLHQGEAATTLPRLAAKLKPTVLYLDPMFPHRQKSALVKKEMRLVRRLVGEDPDAKELLPLALKHAARRVVCKRPRTAPPLGGTPSTAITTKKHRFDIYLT